jgi:hypothetical protein
VGGRLRLELRSSRPGGGWFVSLWVGLVWFRGRRTRTMVVGLVVLTLEGLLQSYCCVYKVKERVILVISVAVDVVSRKRLSRSRRKFTS